MFCFLEAILLLFILKWYCCYLLLLLLFCCWFSSLHVLGEKRGERGCGGMLLISVLVSWCLFWSWPLVHSCSVEAVVFSRLQLLISPHPLCVLNGSETCAVQTQYYECFGSVYRNSCLLISVCSCCCSVFISPIILVAFHSAVVVVQLYFCLLSLYLYI